MNNTRTEEENARNMVDFATQKFAITESDGTTVLHAFSRDFLELLFCEICKLWLSGEPYPMRSYVLKESQLSVDQYAVKEREAAILAKKAASRIRKPMDWVNRFEIRFRDELFKRLG